MSRLDPGGVPLRVRSRLASLRPETKDALASVRDRVVRRPPGVASRSDPWLDELAPRLRGRVLVVGAAVMPDAAPRHFDRLDPLGRGDRLRYLGPLTSEVLGGALYDTIVVVADTADGAVLWEAMSEGLDSAWKALDGGHATLAVMVEADAASQLDDWAATLAADELAAALERRGAGAGSAGETGPAALVARKASR